MPAPPPDLTAASAAVVWEDKTTRRALTTAMLDLASRGELSFKPDGGLLGMHTKTGIQIETPPTDNPYVERNRRRPLSDAEGYALDRLQSIADTSSGNYIAPDDLLEFGKYTTKFNDRLEQHVTSSGWFSMPPGKAIARWAGRGTLAIVGGVVVIIIGFNLPSAGLTLMGGALIAAGVLVMILSRADAPAHDGRRDDLRDARGLSPHAPEDDGAGALDEPGGPGGEPVVARDARPGDGLGRRAWLAGRTLSESSNAAPKTRSRVCRRTTRGCPCGTARGWSSGGTSSGSWGVAPGLFSGSPIPDFGGMFSALSSIGNSPSSSGGGSGGFGGGGSGGGGGGGAGGGF